MNPGHQPERFEAYKELPDATGFTIADCPHVFLFDRYGGWEDEYGNYYNEHGDPDDPPSSSDSHSHSDSSHSQQSDDSAQSDPYEAEFGPPIGDSDDDEQARQQEGAAIIKNRYNLEAYPQGQLLRVYFRNLPHKAPKEEVLKAYSAHAEGILNVIVDKDEQGRGIGTGYFITKPETAEKIIKLEGWRLLSVPLYFQIEDYENFLVFPVEQRELGYQPSAPVKKYVPKNPAKVEEPVVSEAKWGWYKFQKNLFHKITDFRKWMVQHGFNAEEDFRNIEKLEKDPQKRFVKVQMKESAFAAMNGLIFGENTVDFTPL